MEQVDERRLADMLMQGATGMYIHEAAVRLLLGHGYWLRRKDFLSYVNVDSFGRAAIDFDAALTAVDQGELVADEEAEKLLRIAASLSGRHVIRLGDVVEGVDGKNIGLVAEAIMYADGFLNSTAHVQA